MCEKSQDEKNGQERIVEDRATGATEATENRGRDVPVVAVVLAAGFGTRFDPENPKQLVSVGGRPIVQWSIEAFEHNPQITDIVVVVNPKVREAVEGLCEQGRYAKVRMVIDGGKERSDSTQSALQVLADAGIPDDAKVLIHDAVRPFVEQNAIRGCVEALNQFDAATVAVPSTDTVLLTMDLGDRKAIDSVPDRPNTFRAQTPQAFRFHTIREAYAKAADDPDFHPTDDTRVVVDYLPDTPVTIVSGSETNLKITTLADIPVAEGIAGTLAEARANDAEYWRNRMHALVGSLHG
ncbi:2-C-methyl-D-erythritol 4-phosphate cytidylyltransferase [Bifidobacterium margollesii]|uniref:2-C-methyl-D-erythritol 4-phosphate cytidylyltransferase n=1 Tax=Bifidobacterium margollesii TaxID=2020964 RepID=A0A2N5JCP3_9BIFI|nr:2-C-methyl-D-erythritol 4-phosphate cytidylyltransferase [Bifidobacterium margollesii]